MQIKHSRYSHFILATIFFALQGGSSGAQNQSAVDSLSLLLESSKSDTTRVNLMNELAAEYKNSDFEKALSFATKATTLAEKISFPRGEVAGLNNIGSVHYNKGDYDQAIEYHNKAYQLSKENQYKAGMALSLNFLGIDYHNKGVFTKATEYYFKSLKISEAIKDIRVSASSYNGIANIYYAQSSYDKSLEYHKKSLRIKESMKDKKGIATSMNNIGLCYQEKNDFGLAEFYFLKSLMLREEINDKKGIASCLTNIGRLYSDQHAHDQALTYYKKAKVIREELNDKRGLCVILDYIGDSYAGKKDYPKALEYLNRSLDIAEEIGAQNLYPGIYQSLAETHALMKDFEKAFTYEQKLLAINTELMRSEGADYVEQLQVIAEKEKQDQELLLKQQELEINETNLEKKNAIIFGGIIGSVLLLILAVLIYRSDRQKKKANKELAEKNMLIGIKNKDITDSINYAKRIQQAILPADKMLGKSFSEHFVFFLPKDIVSGDFYWAANPHTSPGSFFLAVCDSTGHGVPGAFMSLLNISYLNEAVAEKHLDEPEAIFDHVRKRLIENVSHDGSQDGMDGILLAVRSGKDGKTIEYAAANNEPILVSNGKLVELPCDKMPIGYAENSAAFSNRSFKVATGDVIYLITDGYADQFGGPDGKKLKHKLLQKLLLEISSRSMTEQKEFLNREFIKWKGDLEQVDDVLIIGLKV